MRGDTRALMMALVLVVASGSAGAATFNVVSFMDYPDTNLGDGSCFSTIGVCTLRAAVQQANQTPGDDVIMLPEEHYYLTIAGQDEDSAVTGDLDVWENLSIYGQGAEVTIIDAAGLDRVFELHSGTLELVGLTVTGGDATTGTTLLGGGIRAAGDLLTIGGCRLVDNTAHQGGAIFASTVTSVQIMDSLLAGNSTVSGPYNPWGAAIRAEGGLTLESSTVTGNTGATTGYYAVDAQCYNGSVSILNSTIAANQAAGIGTYSCDVSILHATIADNASSGLVLGSFDNTDVRTVTSTILAGNGGDCNMASSAAVTLEHSLDSDSSCVSFGGAGYLSATDPQLLPLRRWGGFAPTMYPEPMVSPAIDSGSAAACYVTDQRGVVRGGDGNGDAIPGCDMGAVEAGDLLFFDSFEGGDTGAW